MNDYDDDNDIMTCIIMTILMMIMTMMMMLTSGGKLPTNDAHPRQFWLIALPPCPMFSPCPTNIIKYSQGYYFITLPSYSTNIIIYLKTKHKIS